MTTALLPRFPSFTQINLSSLIPAGVSRVRVVIHPVVPLVPPPVPPSKFWGFASITNNETSHVTVVTP